MKTLSAYTMFQLNFRKADQQFLLPLQLWTTLYCTKKY